MMEIRGSRIECDGTVHVYNSSYNTHLSDLLFRSVKV